MHEVEREVLVPGTPEETWRAVVESDWLGEDVRIDPRPDGEVSVRDPAGEESSDHPAGEESPSDPAGQDRVRHGFVEEADPPHRLVFWWSEPGYEGSRVEITLEREEEGTRVRVVESRPLAILDAYGTDLGAAIGIRGPQALAAA
jgi:uncharacterized protein YndB with AHSA1/START domain